MTSTRALLLLPFFACALAGSQRATAASDNDGDANDVGLNPGAAGTVGSGGVGGQVLGGFFGFGLIGVGLSRISHPVGVALAVAGVARTMYTNVVGKGKNVAFPADTPIEVPLAPGPTPALR